MLKTPSGISMLVRLVHSVKAYAPISVTFFGIVTLERDSHPKNA